MENLHLQLAVAAVITDDQQRILLMKRGHKARTQHGRWESVGGAVEPGETPEQAMHREALEELGVELYLDSTLLDYTPVQDGTSESWRTVVFKAHIKSGIPKIMEPDFCTALRWVERSELPKLSLTTYAREDFIKIGWL